MKARKATLQRGVSDTSHEQQQQRLLLLHANQMPAEAEHEALARESRRVTDAVQGPLERMLTLQELPLHGSLVSFKPELTLRFSRHPRAADTWRNMFANGLSVRHIAAALQAIETVLSHAAKLTTRDKLRSAFWIQLFASKVMDKEPRQSAQYFEWLVERSGNDLFPQRVVFKFGELNKKQMDAVRQFFIRDGVSRQHQQQRVHCEFGLSFTRLKLSMACLRLIQELLEDISDPEVAHQRRYYVHSLDLSHCAMQPALMDVVSEILSKSHVYQLHDVNLADITRVSLSDINQTLYWLLPSHANQPSLARLTRAAFGATAAETQRPSKSSVGQRMRRCLSLAGNPLDMEHFVSMCSSLRYGCVYDEISLASMLRYVETSIKREECWRWIAFGLFYPRSKRFASAFHLKTIDMSGIFFDQDGIPAFARTMASPITELRRGERTCRGPGSCEDSIIVCHLAQGATVYSLPDKASTRLTTLENELAWEALYTEGDTEWLSVVVPGYGLGWVDVRHVNKREQEMLVETERLGLILNRFRVRIFTDQNLENGHEIHLNTLLSSIGHRLRSLELRSVEEIDFSAAFSHCSHLEHLELKGIALHYSPAIRALLKFLGSQSGCQLRSLNLNGTPLDDAETRELADLLRSTRYLPRLRELRLFNYSLSAGGLEMLGDALSENRTIGLVELCASFPADVREEFSYKHDNAKVDMITLPLSHKLALISIFTNEASTSRAGDNMERWILERIFELAGFPVQRKILWVKSASRVYVAEYGCSV
ncbi:hypothetical protein Gpo141_00005971 [Globisporangium polare]